MGKTNLIGIMLSYCALLMGIILTDALAGGGRYVEDNPDEIQLMPEGSEYTWLIGLSLIVLILGLPSLITFLKNKSRKRR